MAGRAVSLWSALWADLGGDPPTVAQFTLGPLGAALVCLVGLLTIDLWIAP
jgi:hypothetical protein